MSRRLKRRVGLRRSKPAIGSKRKSKPTIGSKRWRKKRRFRAPDNECYICYDEFDHTKCEPYGCGHFFHAHCIERWRNSGNTSNHSRCPYCKKTGSYNILRKPPQTYEEVLQTIRSLPPSIKNVYVNTPPPIGAHSHVELELMSSLTRPQEEGIAQAIIDKETIQKLRGPQEYDSVSVHAPLTDIQISSYCISRFFRSFEVVQAKRLDPNTAFHILFSQAVNEIGGEWWYWNDFVEIARSHANSVRYLTVWNTSSIDRSNFDMSEVSPMPNLLNLCLGGRVNFESTIFERYPKLKAITLSQYNYAENASCSLLHKLKELNSLRVIELVECMGWEGGRGKNVLVLVLAALREDSLLQIRHSPSLFCSNDAQFAAEFFSALLSRRIANVTLWGNRIETQFHEWKERLSNEDVAANAAILNNWNIR